MMYTRRHRIKTISCIIFSLFLWCSGYGQSRLTGRILYHNSGEKPAVGVEVNAPGANSVFTAGNGLFILKFGSKKPGDNVRLILGSTDGKGKRIALINKKSIANLSISSDPDGNIIELFVVSPKQLKTSRAQFYDILEKEISGRYDKQLDNIEKQLKKNTLDAEVIKTLSTTMKVLRKERDSALGTIKKQAAYIAGINKDRADEKLKAAVRNIEKGEYIRMALDIVDSMRLRGKAEKRKLRNKARYTLYLGTNFNLPDAYLPEDLYFEMEATFPDVLKSGWGISARIYKNTLSKPFEEAMLRPHHYEREPLETDSYDFIQTGMAPGRRTESFGFSLAMPYRLIALKQFSLSVAPHIEVIHRIEKYNYEIAYSNVLTTVSLPDDPQTPKPLLPGQVRSNHWESYFGLSLPLRYCILLDIFEITVNPIFGGGYPGPDVSFTTFYTGLPGQQYVHSVDNDSGPLFFGAFQGNIIISPLESFGISLGADVRHFFNTDSDPIVNLYIAAKVDLARLLKAAKK